jgi:large subunit ribosomal protein L13
MKTEFPSRKEITRSWHLLDADSLPLGRVASRTAMLLMGKHKPSYTPFLDTGDHVIVVNAAKVRLTGRKEEQKLYRRHSGYPGGLSQVGAAKVRATRPARLVYEAVAGMLPKTKLGKQMLRKLRVYPADKHPHQAQKPVAMPAVD